MAFYVDRPDILTQVQWYFVPDTNPQLRLTNRFSSRIWDRKDPIVDPIGEQLTDHPWRGGLPPFAVPVGGLCGTPQQWANGALTTDPVPVNYPLTNIPECCNYPEGVFGAILLGAQFTPQASMSPVDCPPCPASPAVWNMVFQGFESGPDCINPPTCESLNGATLQATYLSGCGWGGTYRFLACNSTVTVGVGWALGVWNVFINIPAGGSTLTLTSPMFNCWGVNTFSGTITNIGFTFCKETPITCTISPAP